MFLYLLESKRSVPLDAYESFLIRARDSKEARRIANIKHADEGHIWEDPKLSSCRKISDRGKPGIIISSFNAG